jgi:DNA-binding protein HU-beta
MRSNGVALADADIPGLGKAVKARRKARSGRNPHTGEAIKIPVTTVVKFRLAKTFKDTVFPPKKK